jgi:c-di-GMP phosphodiesterase
LLSYLVAGTLFYASLRTSIMQLERNRIELAATELGASFSKYSTFAESYISALLQSKAFQSLIKTEQSIYREITLGAAIENALKDLKRHRSRKLSFAVFDVNDSSNQLYFFELSDDPFANVSKQQKELVASIISNQQTESWNYMKHDALSGMVVVSKMINRYSGSAPLLAQLNDSVLAQFAIEPSDFFALQTKLLSELPITISIHSDQANNDKTEGISASHSISDDYFLTVTLPASYMDSKLDTIKLQFALFSTLFFLASTMLVLRLIRRYVTDPITSLEQQLSDVIEQRKGNIETTHSKDDEIGRLERSFHKIYGDLAESYAKTKELSEHDSLTMLHNLSYINQHAQEALEEAKYNGEQVALIYIDLDNFKFVNDKYGHEVGDKLLIAFSARLSQIVRQANLLSPQQSAQADHARIAGDEFSIVLTHYNNNPAVPEKMAKRILRVFENGFSFELGTFPVSASIGIALYPRDGHTLSQLVSNADHAMYQAKSSGKNQMAYYSQDLAINLRRKTEIEHELKSIDFDDEFYLVYMPLIHTSTNQVYGFEVLVRWTSKKLGQVWPDEFIPISESSGLFDKIDRWVSESAIKQYQLVKDLLGRDFKLSINLSSAQLNMNEIDEHLCAAIDKYNVPAESIQLEMTETLNVEYTTVADALLQRLAQKGFRIAIDDFGTGYTALLQLLEYPAHMIKFDKAFIDKAIEPDNRSMLEPLIALCNSQDLEVTAEGVETKEMADYLSSIGCNYLQGYFYGKPTELADLATLIQRLADNKQISIPTLK